MADDHSTASQEVSVERNEEIFNNDGTLVGVVTEATEEGFTVDTVADVTVEGGDAAMGDEENPGQEFGEGYIMWRCTECGEMGELEDGMPAECPACGAPREVLARQLED